MNIDMKGVLRASTKRGVKEFFGARFTMDHSVNMDIAKGGLGWPSALPREARALPSSLTKICFSLKMKLII